MDRGAELPEAPHGPEAVHPCRYRHEPETGDPCRYRGRAAGRRAAVASAGASTLRRKHNAMNATTTIYVVFALVLAALCCRGSTWWLSGEADILRTRIALSSRKYLFSFGLFRKS